MIGHRIKALRKNLGLTQAQVSARARLAPGHLSKIEGDANVETATLERIASAMGVTMGELWATEPHTRKTG
jgi:transcriptional regulator with XRE-family HTH domain